MKRHVRHRRKTREFVQNDLEFPDDVGIAWCDVNCSGTWFFEDAAQALDYLDRKAGIELCAECVRAMRNLVEYPPEPEIGAPIDRTQRFLWRMRLLAFDQALARRELVEIDASDNDPDLLGVLKMCDEERHGVDFMAIEIIYPVIRKHDQVREVRVNLPGGRAPIVIERAEE